MFGLGHIPVPAPGAGADGGLCSEPLNRVRVREDVPGSLLIVDESADRVRRHPWLARGLPVTVVNPKTGSC